MPPHSPSPVLHKKEMDASSVRANLKLLVNSSQQAAKAKEEVMLSQASSFFEIPISVPLSVILSRFVYHLSTGVK